VVLKHFKHPQNRGPLVNPSVSIDGANPLCGDRIRIELRVESGTVVDVGFTADACAICIATASVITERVRGMSLDETNALDVSWVEEALEGAPPPARHRCVTLAVDTLHRAIAAGSTGA
jgi:nitrogen fixation NifU-like protein